MKKIITSIICIAIPLIVGGISAALTSGNMLLFSELNKPPLSPPGWLFPVAWTILYILMGIACARVVLSDIPEKKVPLIVYGLQLCFNFFWSIWFFNLHLYWFAAIWLIVMIGLIIAFMIIVRRDRLALLCFAPYILWCCFALYLNIGAAVLN